MPVAIFRYSSLATKIRAKIGKMLKEEDYESLLKLKSVNNVAGYLKHHTNYSEILVSVNDLEIHRGELETIFKKSIIDEAIKLMKYTDGNVNQFLHYIFIRFEIEDLKLMIRRLKIGEDLTKTQPYIFYLGKYTTIPIEKLMKAKDIEQFINELKGTPYYNILNPLFETFQNVNMFQIEMVLDLYFYNWVIAKMKKLLNGQNRKIIHFGLGKECDLLNILWIYRCKVYFNMNKELIYRYLIPYQYCIGKRKLNEMVEAKDSETLMELISNTRYGKLFEEMNPLDFEQNITKSLRQMHHRLLREKPFSISTIVSYLHIKEFEIRNIITIIEGIRYGLKPETIKEYIKY